MAIPDGESLGALTLWPWAAARSHESMVIPDLSQDPLAVGDVRQGQGRGSYFQTTSFLALESRKKRLSGTAENATKASQSEVLGTRTHVYGEAGFVRDPTRMGSSWKLLDSDMSDVTDVFHVFKCQEIPRFSVH